LTRFPLRAVVASRLLRPVPSLRGFTASPLPGTTQGPVTGRRWDQGAFRRIRRKIAVRNSGLLPEQRIEGVGRECIRLAVLESVHDRYDEAALQGQQLAAVQARQFVEDSFAILQQMDLDQPPILGRAATR